jgi:hypothetical protein
MSKNPNKEVYEQKLKQLQEMEDLLRSKQGLPHRFAYPWYPWARRVYESKNKEVFLTAANQVSKSSTAIRKNIELATNPSLWKEYWPGLRDGQKPGLFWYMYPTKEVATTEVEQKWEKEFLPRGEYKDHPQYGWELEYNKGEIWAIHFKTGVTIQFKTYAQKAKDLQTSSVYHLTCDEELPIDLLPELKARLNATDGYFLMVFTATLGQLYWSLTMEPPTAEEEKHKDALKIRASLFDSMAYDDGTPSPWTEAKIARAISNCPTEAEIQRRIYGRFVKSEGLLYEAFSLEKNMSDNHPLPKDWHIFTGVDPGSGGKSGHPAAMVYIAVKPDFKEGRVFRAWRGDGIPTTSSDILEKYRELRAGLAPTAQIYDYASKDFYLVASQMGEAFQPAEKNKERGISLVNTLFKTGMLKLQRNDPEISKLVQELSSIGPNSKKSGHVDDLSDCLRYAALAVPWDFAGAHVPTETRTQFEIETAKVSQKSENQLRREWFLNSDDKKSDLSPEDELDLWDNLVHDSYE